jgi:hypothetical protein
MAGNNIKERIDDYYRQNPIPAAVSAAILLAPTTGIKDVPPHMSQNLLEVVENLHATVSTDPDNTDDDEAIIQALQQALEQKKKRVWFDGVEIPARKGKAPESILKQPDHAGVTKGTNPSTAGPATLSRTTIAAPAVTLPTVKNTAASNTSGPQYRYTTPVEDPTIVRKVVNCTLDIPISITQRELLSISPEARKQYKELTTTR